MAILQHMLPGRAGVAAALYGNTIGAGALVSGLGTGLWANAFGYMALFAVCAALSVVGGLALLVRSGPAVTDR
jgi:MFS transporter, SET family, sugar efflux transporter